MLWDAWIMIVSLAWRFWESWLQRDLGIEMENGRQGLLSGIPQHENEDRTEGEGNENRMDGRMFMLSGDATARRSCLYLFYTPNLSDATQRASPIYLHPSIHLHSTKFPPCNALSAGLPRASSLHRNFVIMKFVRRLSSSVVVIGESSRLTACPVRVE